MASALRWRQSSFHSSYRTSSFALLAHPHQLDPLCSTSNWTTPSQVLYWSLMNLYKSLVAQTIYIFVNCMTFTRLTLGLLKVDIVGSGFEGLRKLNIVISAQVFRSHSIPNLFKHCGRFARSIFHLVSTPEPFHWPAIVDPTPYHFQYLFTPSAVNFRRGTGSSDAYILPVVATPSITIVRDYIHISNIH